MSGERLKPEVLKLRLKSCVGLFALFSDLMYGLHHEILPPSGVEFATSLKLTPSTHNVHDNPTFRHEFAARSVCNVVVARSNLLRIFEVRLELPPISSQAEDERERSANVRKGTEAVEGEVEMDIQGDGFINIDKVIRVYSVFQNAMFHSNGRYRTRAN